MKLVESILTKHPCYTDGQKITVKGLMLHSVGCPQPSAKVFINDWYREDHRSACVHAFIDGNDGTVYQTLPWDHLAWHCGKGNNGSGNRTHIGVEMCEPACIKYTGGASFTCSDMEIAKAVVKRTYGVAVELFADLCKKYGLDPLSDGVIISHAEGYKRGISSNHGDPEHLWSQLGVGYTMDGFRKDVKAAMTGESKKEDITEENTTDVEVQVEKWYRVRKSWADAKSQKGAYKTLKYAKTCADNDPGYAVYDWNGKQIYPEVKKEEDKVEVSEKVESFTAYRVRVSIPDLNIRKGPGINYDKVGYYTGIGVFTIVAEADGKGASKWGKLKSGAGWISLDYGKRI